MTKKDETIQVLKCWTDVLIKNTSLKAVITWIMIQDERVTYELSYFAWEEAKTLWFSNHEFTCDIPEFIRIGFQDT